MVDIVKGGGRAPPPSPARADFTLNYGMYARNRPLPLCVYSVAGKEDAGVGVFSVHV
jgi:hypothetical protein